MKKILLIPLLLFLFNCKVKNKSSENKATATKVIISKGNIYGSGAEGIKEQNLIISNTKDWKRLITKMNTVNNVSKNFSETNIDFEKYQIIAVFETVKPTGGYGLDLDIKPNSESIEVKIIRRSPEGMATSVMTQPYVIAKLNKSDLPIRFLK